LEKAFNGGGYSYVENYYEYKSPAYESVVSYLNNANKKNMKMSNLELSVESIEQLDDNHYMVIANMMDEYHYRDGTGDRKKIRAHYKVRVTSSGDMMFSEDPTVEVLEKVEF